MRRVRRAIVIAALSVTACRGGCSACAGASRDALEGGAPAVIDTAMVLVDAGPLADTGSALAAPRCTATGTMLPLAPAAALGDLAVGDAIVTPNEVAIGVVRRRTDAPGRSGKVLSVALLTPSLDRVTFVDLGTPRGDDPPPRPFLHDGSLWVAWYEHPKDASASRSLVVAPLPRADAKTDPAASLPHAVSIPQGADESLAFDVATVGGATLVAWDDDGAKTGVIKVALVGGPEAIASPESSDAESPRLAPRAAGGAWLVWIARRPEVLGEEEAGLEGPGESRTYRWLEAVALDGAGKRVGDVHRLTPASGHVAAFDVLATPTGVEVVAREDDEAREGNGARVLRITLRDAPLPAMTLVAEGAGGGAPELVGTGELAWATFTDPSEHVRIVPVLLTASPSIALHSALPSAEPALEGGRILAVAPAPNGPLPGTEPNLVALTEKGEARFVHCAR